MMLHDCVFLKLYTLNMLTCVIYLTVLFFLQEFEDYYEGVSLGFESDEEFTAMMRNCWGI